MTRLSIVLFVLLNMTACNSDQDKEWKSTKHEGQEWSLLDQNHGGNRSAWGLSDCVSCHLLSSIHQERANIQPLVESKGYDSCAGCHGSNGTTLVRQCTVCHNQKDLPNNPLQLGSLTHQFKTQDDSSLSSLTDEHCIACHNLSDMNGEFNLQVDLTRLLDHNGERQPYRNQTDFCLRCHNSNHTQLNSPNDAMDANYEYIDWHGYIDGSGVRSYSGLRKNQTLLSGYDYKTQVDCTDCHEMHGTHNKQLIVAASSQGLSKLEPVFKQNNHSITVANDDFSQLCVMCHVMEIPLEDSEVDTGNGLSGVHVTGTECRSCHQHGLSTQVGL